jgi:hypothetical protein
MQYAIQNLRTSLAVRFNFIGLPFLAGKNQVTQIMMCARLTDVVRVLKSKTRPPEGWTRLMISLAAMGRHAPLDNRNGYLATQVSELGHNGTCHERHCNDEGKAHGSSDQAIFNGGCAGFIFEKRVHLKTPELMFDSTVLLTCSTMQPDI